MAGPRTVFPAKATASPPTNPEGDVVYLSVGLDGSLRATVGFATFAKRYDQADSTTAYLGDAAVASAEGSAVWRIQKLVFGVDGDVTITWADGDTSFDNIWTNRASLTYT